METITVHCPHCGQVMSVAQADRGGKVHCPHCDGVVEAPAADAPLFEAPSAAEQESIFSPPEESAEDLFGAAGPRLEMPPGESPALPSSERTASYLERPTSGQPDPAGAAPASGSALDLPAAATHEEPAFGSGPLTPPAQAAGHRAAASGGLAPLVLVFLIPYSIVITGAAVYLWLLQARGPAFDPLERLPDPQPNPKEGGAKRVAHNAPLPDKLKVRLKQTLRVGDVEVTPLAIDRSQLDELGLRLRLKNVSSDVQFDPLPQSFVSYRGAAPGALRPYTFLEFGDEAIYGGVVEHERPPRAGAFDGVLAPGEEVVVLLRTTPNYRRKVLLLDSHRGAALWRVQVRRGLVATRGGEVSATAVVGVVLDAADVPPPGPLDAGLRSAPAGGAREGGV